MSQPVDQLTLNSIIGSNSLTVEEETISPQTHDPLLFGRRTAKVWQHFTLFKEDGKIFSTCKHCNAKTYRAEGSQGTNNQNKHLEKCVDYLKIKAVQSGGHYDQKTFCRMFAEAIMCHAYPLLIVEHTKHRELLSYLNPNVKHISRNTMLKHCTNQFAALKAQLKTTIGNLEGKVCCTCDLWSALNNVSYTVLTAHYVDNSWMLRSKILVFRHFTGSHTGKELGKFTLDLFDEWDIRDKVFSLTCDNASANDVMIQELVRDLNRTNLLPCSGKFFHVRYSAHILNLIVQAGFKFMDKTVLKLQQVVTYVSFSNLRTKRFDDCLKYVNNGFSGSLIGDVRTRWNSAYLMLRRCLEAREAVDRYCLLEHGLDVSLSDFEWETVQNVCDFLEPFYDMTCLFSGSDYPTANLYVENIVLIESLLFYAKQNPTESIRLMAAPMYDKFNKYWENYSLILTIAIMLDPRYKKNFVHELYATVYLPQHLDGKVKEAVDAFTELYMHYASVYSHLQLQPSSTTTSSMTTSSMTTPARPFKKANLGKSFGANVAASRGIENDMESYFSAPHAPADQDDHFDVLAYWKTHVQVYPILSRMARDVLAIPITSVASESSFSMGGRILTKYRTCLLPKNVEDLVTCQNWIFGYSKIEDEESLEVVKDTEPTDIDYDSIP